MRAGVLIAGKYTLLEPKGAGGMGAVWRARNELTEREFAIKLLHPAAAENPRTLMRFFQEAKVSGRLRHPSVLEIFDVGTAAELGGAPFLVMELLDGASLDVVLAARPLSLRATLRALVPIARALDLAHGKGIVHRDVKPANIFLHRPPGGGVVPKVLDFGISKFAEGALPEATHGLTQTGAVLGSPLYMSPEQAAGDAAIDARSDVHALGVVLYECLTGKPPFRSETYNKLVVEIMTGERPRLGDALPGVPEGVATIAERAFARRPEERFATAAAFADALEHELARLGADPVADARALADELAAALAVVAPEGAVQTEVSGGATTTAASSMARPVLAGSPPVRVASPAAYTVGQVHGRPGGPATLPYAATEELAAPQPPPHEGGHPPVAAATLRHTTDEVDGRGVPAPRSRRRAATLVVATTAIAFVAVAGGLALHGGGPGAALEGADAHGVRALAAPESALPAPESSARVKLADSEVPRAASEERGRLADVAAQGAGDASSRDAGHPSPGGVVPVASASPAPRRAPPRTGPRTPGAGAVVDPHRGITNSGL